MEIVRCLIYFAITGVLSFVIGRMLPKRWFRYDAIPYRSARFEKEGAIYNKLNIKSWQNKVPDMSRIFPKMMPAKRLGSKTDAGTLKTMLQETCIAELTHGVLCFTGLHFVSIWQGAGGTVLAVLNMLGNLPFILIQRYNRPRLAKLLRRYEAAERTQRSKDPCAC